MDDRELIRLCRSRSPEAAAECAAVYGRYCFLLAQNILGDEAEAQDCVEETWREALDDMPERPGILRAFFGRLTRRVALARCFPWVDRGGQYSEVLAELGGPTEGSPSRGSQAAMPVIASATDAYLRGLGETERRAFVCRYWYFDPMEQVCARFGLTADAAAEMLAGVRGGLMRRLDERGCLFEARPLLDAIGDIGGDLIIDARAAPEKRRRVWPWLLATAALAAAVILIFINTAPGRALLGRDAPSPAAPAAETAPSEAPATIEALFEPVSTTYMLEGLETEVLTLPYGELHRQAGSFASYVIYIEEGYDVTVTDNLITARPSSVPGGGSPSEWLDTYLELTQLPGVPPETRADELMQEAERNGTELIREDGDGVIYLRHQGGNQPESLLLCRILRDNGRGGCFSLTVQAPFAAAEGHYARLLYAADTLRTFTLE